MMPCSWKKKVSDWKNCSRIAAAGIILCYHTKMRLSLIDFLEENDGFKNRHGVSLRAFEENILFISNSFLESLGSEVAKIEIDKVFEEGFFEGLFRLKCIVDLETITHKYLPHLYHVGIMEVTCLIDERRLGGERVFKNTTVGKVVSDGETNIAHLADREVSTFDDFVS